MTSGCPAPAPTYAQQQMRAGTIAAGLRHLLHYIQSEPAVGQALALIDTDDLRGPLDGAGLQLLLHEIEAEHDRCAALAERDARRQEAGHLDGAACTCGHSDTLHTRHMTEDDRLPCHRPGCRCHDLIFELR
ncbi:hypothetical protein ACFVQ9_26095 [Streptomyces goshikiensis]|uniref:hypothetical protein n=1 Tax=Streptomyces goshikiensis TaxID=1942 RepID=UPI0036A94415